MSPRSGSWLWASTLRPGFSHLPTHLRVRAGTCSGAPLWHLCHSSSWLVLLLVQGTSLQTETTGSGCEGNEMEGRWPRPVRIRAVSKGHPGPPLHPRKTCRGCTPLSRTPQLNTADFGDDLGATGFGPLSKSTLEKARLYVWRQICSPIVNSRLCLVIVMNSK